MSSARERLDQLFVPGSPLAAQLAGFAHRPEQLEMARLVADAMEQGGHLAIEAGAGTGKTLAYLVPALLSQRRVIVATATKTLQDQLYHRDLPVLGRALGRPVKVAQLKGRSNYLCRHRLQRAGELPEALTPPLRRALRAVGGWALRTESGDVSELAEVAEDSAIWPLVTSTTDNCLGGRCPEIERCHVAVARRRAADADLAIVNHHLLLADLTLKDDGFGRLLPGAEVVVVDEAHRFPETAQAHFDVTLNSRQVHDLLRDVAAEAREAPGAAADLQGPLAAVARALAGTALLVPASGEPLALASAPPRLVESLCELAEDLECLHGVLDACSGDNAGLARCSERAAALAAAAARIGDWEANADLCWAQGAHHGFTVHLTPLDASRQLRELLRGQGCAWIFTSATLAVGDDFSHFCRQLGLDGLATRRIESPYDYVGRARLYLPRGLPAPGAPDFTDRAIAAIAPLLQASRGRAFLLFTSHRALQRAAELLGGNGQGHVLLVQGSAPRSRLLDAFATTPNAVLLGTATFWEGVDIRGPALVVVAIDRLPFASPGDPLLQARLELVRRQGGDPFRDYQLPQAVFALRQGVGRLIRDYTDYGIVVICDPRLTSRSYGRAFLASLPPLPVVNTAAEASAFLAAHEAAA